jgi:hypothetical protein
MSDKYNLQKITSIVFDINTKYSDIYVTSQGIWLIDTNKSIWITELDTSGILWYNYIFFKKLLFQVNLDIRRGNNYIGLWFQEKLDKFGVENNTWKVKSSTCSIGKANYHIPTNEIKSFGVRDIISHNGERQSTVNYIIKNNQNENV